MPRLREEVDRITLYIHLKHSEMVFCPLLYLEDCKIKLQKKKTLKASWKKLTNVSGYQIQYAPNKKLKKAKRKTVKSTSVTIKKLKKKKTYFVRVRAYKLVDGKKVYGKWSAVKKVKIKK